MRHYRVMEGRSLDQYLREQRPQLAKELDAIRAEARKIWEEPNLRKLTEHGPAHIEQVERNLDALTRPLQRSSQPLLAEEVFVLLAACWLHDIGMQLDVEDAREGHAGHSLELILHSRCRAGERELSVELPIPDDNAREAIARVARAHWTSFALKEPEEDYVYGNVRGRLRLLGVLLATADLLDLSPVRAGYYRSPHRLVRLDARGELHHTTHKLVKGLRIEPADTKVPDELQLELTWRDDSDEVRQISDWMLHWLSSQWRQLAPELHSCSRGSIRWATPWARTLFQPPLGPRTKLSPAARSILAVERADQERIDRDAFAESFSAALERHERSLFVIPAAPDGDARRMADWCLARARRAEGMCVAWLPVRPETAIDLPGLVAAAAEQWGEHLPELTGEEAAERQLKRLLSPARDRQRGHCVVLVVESRDARWLAARFLGSFFGKTSKVKAPRVAVVVAYRPGEFREVAGVAPRAVDWAAITVEDLEQHLRVSWGLSEEKSRREARYASRLGLLERAGLLYVHVEKSGKLWADG